MIWLGNGKFKFESEHNELHMRSCWECNSAHDHLRESSYFHWCFECGKLWCLGWDFSCDASDEEFDAHFSSRGLKPGDSTTKIKSTADEVIVVEVQN